MSLDRLECAVTLPDGRRIYGTVYGKYYPKTFWEPDLFEPNTEDTALEMQWLDTGVELSWLNDERTEILENGEELDIYVFNQVLENGILFRCEEFELEDC